MSCGVFPKITPRIAHIILWTNNRSQLETGGMVILCIYIKMSPSSPIFFTQSPTRHSRNDRIHRLPALLLRASLGKLRPQHSICASWWFQTQRSKSPYQNLIRSHPPSRRPLQHNHQVKCTTVSKSPNTLIGCLAFAASIHSVHMHFKRSHGVRETQTFAPDWSCTSATPTWM